MKRRRRRKSHAKQIILLLLSIEALLIISGLAYVQFRPMVVDAVTIEAGTEPDIEEFMLYKNRKGSFITDVQKMNLTIPGIYEVKIKIGRRVLTSNLEIKDSIAPVATVTDLMVLRDEKVEAAAFVSKVEDATEVTVSYKDQPDTSKPGEQEVIVIVEDSSQNRTELKAMLTVLDIKSSVTIEAGSKMDITVADFVGNDKYEIGFITDLLTLDISKPIVHKIQLNVNGREVIGNIEVVDTTPPAATIVNKTIWNDETLPAIAFVEDINDVSGVKADYKETPEFTKVGDSEIQIILKDDYGNSSEYKAMLTVKTDSQPPQILGTRNKTVYIGDGVAYRKGVTAKDDKDGEIKFNVDSSQVDLNTEGVYNVQYSAQDKAGNQARTNTTVTVIKFAVTEELVNSMAEEILVDIITDTMTKQEQAAAIYSWVKKHVGYTGHSDKSDWLAEAYRGMKDGVGDCFTFYAVARSLLTNADITNMQVTRVGGKTQHFWNLINCGDGWYHYDTTPNKDKKEAFMLTDLEVEKLTELRGNNYYVYDKALYPPTPEE